MSKGLRLTQQWMQRGLWLVAFLFAGFLIGLGGKVVENLWSVEEPISFEQFIDPVQGPKVRAAEQLAEDNAKAAREARDQAAEKLKVARANSNEAKESFDNWVATRQATARPDQDQELIARNRALDAIRSAERAAKAAVEVQEQALLDASQARDHAAAAWEVLEKPAHYQAWKAEQARELRIFLYRLALTLPLLLIAAWLFVRKRKSQYWPFVWGFIFFATFAFFVELVPYLPSYGGYVRYVVGIIGTVVVGRYAILALQRYLERQKAAEAMPEIQRRETLRYDVAYARLGKSVCPGCERKIDLKDPTLDFCPHCGIGLFDHCPTCKTRKGAFARFCFSCGSPGQAALPD